MIDQDVCDNEECGAYGPLLIHPFRDMFVCYDCYKMALENQYDDPHLEERAREYQARGYDMLKERIGGLYINKEVRVPRCD